MSEQDGTRIIVCACGQKMKIPAGVTGKSYKCVRCGKKIEVLPEEAPPEDQDARIGELLVKHGLLTGEALEAALDEQRTAGGKLLEVLVQSEALDKEALHTLLSRQSGVPTINLANYHLDRALLELVDREVALREKVLPIDRLGKLLTVAMACPLDTATIKAMEASTGLRVKAMLCRWDDIENAVQRWYPAEEGEEAPVVNFEHLLQPVVRTEDLRELITQVRDLPASDATIEALESLPEDAEAAFAALALLVEQDPPLALHVLAHANSPAYGLRGGVDTLASALSLASVRGVIRLGRRHSAKGSPARLDTDSAGRRAHAAASVARALASASGRTRPALAATCGALHEVGRFALAEMRPEKYASIDAKLGGHALAVEEKALFSLDHGEAGAAIARVWGLPETVQAGLRHYLNPNADLHEHWALASAVALGAAAAQSPEHFDAAACADHGAALEGLEMSAEAAAAAIQEALDARAAV